MFMTRGRRVGRGRSSFQTRAWDAHGQSIPQQDLSDTSLLRSGIALRTLGFDAFVDELYLVPAARGQGLGRKALRVAETACAELGVNALHLEVEPGNTDAQELYRRMGFVGSQRTLMTKRMRRLQE